MIEADRLVAATPREREEQQDRAIRPLKLAEYIGQPVVREQMELFIQAARGRSEALDHTLIFGPPATAASRHATVSKNSTRLIVWPSSWNSITFTCGHSCR